jgi:hypothetical protein
MEKANGDSPVALKSFQNVFAACDSNMIPDDSSFQVRYSHFSYLIIFPDKLLIFPSSNLERTIC